MIGSAVLPPPGNSCTVPILTAHPVSAFTSAPTIGSGAANTESIKNSCPPLQSGSRGKLLANVWLAFMVIVNEAVWCATLLCTGIDDPSVFPISSGGMLTTFTFGVLLMFTFGVFATVTLPVMLVVPCTTVGTGFAVVLITSTPLVACAGAEGAMTNDAAMRIPAARVSWFMVNSLR